MRLLKHACCQPSNTRLMVSCCRALTWDDGALNTQGSAVLCELDELFHIIEQLGDDDLGTSVNLHETKSQLAAIQTSFDSALTCTRLLLHQQ